MTTKPFPTDLPIQAFASASDFSTFLESNHSTAPGLYVKFAKKGTGVPSILPAEAVETALCYGWIDGRANSIDETWWTVRYTPRRAKSIWSQKNVDTIERLIADGKMKPSGLAQVQAAKSDGRWEKAYAGPATIVVPDDFQAALEENKRAKRTFEELNKSQRYSYLHKLATVSSKGREKKIAVLVEELAGGTSPGAIPLVAKKLATNPKKDSARSVTKVASKKASVRQQAAPRAKPETATVGEQVSEEKPRRAGLRARPQG